jgi:hypothetical protein
VVLVVADQEEMNQVQVLLQQQEQLTPVVVEEE